MKQRHRIFIAINFSEEIKKKLDFYQRKIEELFTPYRPAESGTGAGPIRWTRVENLHITLAFIGYAADEELLEVCKITKEVAQRHPSFFVNLNKICYGPTDKKPPRMVWVEGEKSEDFTSLKEDLDKSLEVSENREFSPHITLGRIKQWQWRKIEPDERPTIEEEINLSFSVDSIEVMESILKRGGPEYNILETHNLELET